MLQLYSVTVLQLYSVTVLNVTELQCYIFTALHLYKVTVFAVRYSHCVKRPYPLHTTGLPISTQHWHPTCTELPKNPDRSVSSRPCRTGNVHATLNTNHSEIHACNWTALVCVKCNYITQHFIQKMCFVLGNCYRDWNEWIWGTGGTVEAELRYAASWNFTDHLWSPVISWNGIS